MSEELFKEREDVVAPVGGNAGGAEHNPAAAAAVVTERGRSPSGVTTAAAATPDSVAANTPTLSQEWPENVVAGLCPEESPEANAEPADALPARLPPLSL